MKHSIIHAIALFLLMLITGVFWGTWFTLARSIDQFSAETFIHIGKEIIDNLNVPMRIMVPTGMMMMLVSILVYKDKRSAGFYFAVAAFVIMVMVMVITAVVVAPIDSHIERWTADMAVSESFSPEAMRDTWKTFHTTRTFLCIAAFACFSWSMLIRPWIKEEESQS